MQTNPAVDGETPLAAFFQWLRLHWACEEGKPLPMEKVAHRLGFPGSSVHGWCNRGSLQTADAQTVAQRLDAQARVRFASTFFPDLRITDPASNFSIDGSLSAIAFEAHGTSLEFTRCAVGADADGHTDHDEVRAILAKGELLKNQIDAACARAVDEHRRGIPGNRFRPLP